MPRLLLLSSLALLGACSNPSHVTCVAGSSICGEECVDLQNDSAHCGECNRSCGSTGVCRAGGCEEVCRISEAIVDAGVPRPSNVCQSCQPALSSSSWSPVANGTLCSPGQVCGSGTCQASCFIGDLVRDAGVVNPDDACQVCAPSTSTLAWSTSPDGTPCAPGEVCQGGLCHASCFIDGALHAATDVNPANVCQLCTPASSTSAWSARADGFSCDAGKVCAAGACAAKCFIGGMLYAAGDVNPANGCQACDPSSSTTAWATRADGASCGSGTVCQVGACAPACYFGGGFHAAGEVNIANGCQQCVPASTTTDWTSRGTFALLDGGADVAAQGWTTTTQGLATMTSGADFVQLATSTASGASTGGQLLLSKAGAVEVGAAFTIQAEVQVVSVNAHNQLDSAAAILGSFHPSFGTTAERSEMLYLDAAAIGWGDDTKSATVTVTDGAYHLYTLAVDASGNATVSMDGVSKLTRTGYVTNGTIALGDQTNEKNVDGTMRIRSVSRVCP